MCYFLCWLTFCFFVHVSRFARYGRCDGRGFLLCILQDIMKHKIIARRLTAKSCLAAWKAARARSCSSSELERDFSVWKKNSMSTEKATTYLALPKQRHMLS